MTRCRSYLQGLAVCVTVLLLTSTTCWVSCESQQLPINPSSVILLQVSGVVMIGIGFSSIDDNIPVAKLFEQLSSSDGLLVLQVFGPLTVILAVLGICAATLDHKLLLLVFSGLIFVEFVALIAVASPLVQVQAQMDHAVDEEFRRVNPLHKADVTIQTDLNGFQASDSCCGLRSFEDWENQLPESCLCDFSVPSVHPGHKSQPGDSSSDGSCVLVGHDLHPSSPYVTHKSWVHSKPCGPILKSYQSFPIKLKIGIISALATITMAAVALCLALGLEDYWKGPQVVVTVDDFNRVKYEPKPSYT